MSSAPPEAGFEDWLHAQARISASGMLRSVSATGLVKERPGFGQVVRPVRGSILASPVPAAYDPDPDYFFHWFRDAAVVVDALRQAAAAGYVAIDAADAHFADIVGFNTQVQRLDGRDLLAVDREAQTAPEFSQYLRSDAELAAVHGAVVAAESRLHPDAHLDTTRWARPQHDGPPLRALSLLRWCAWREPAPAVRAQLDALVAADLDFVLARARQPSYDIWEEDLGLHYYPLRASVAALAAGAAWARARGDEPFAASCRREADRLRVELDGFWLPAAGHYRSRRVDPAIDAAKALDISVILAAIHAQPGPPGDGLGHSPGDPRMQATLDRLDAAFHARYAINHDRPPGQGPALGRYVGDLYYGGGAWYVATLGAAEFCFRAAAVSGPDESGRWRRRGDAYLHTVRAFTPADGALAEQFDGADGRPRSAKHLAWSYAAFLTCAAARDAACGGAAPP